MKTIVIILCLIPMLAFAAVKLNFKDKTSMCGDYVLKGNQYCKGMSGGEMCFDKRDIASIEKGDGCEEGGGIGVSSSSTTSSTQNTTAQTDKDDVGKRRTACINDCIEGERMNTRQAWGGIAPDSVRYRCIAHCRNEIPIE